LFNKSQDKFKSAALLQRPFNWNAILIWSLKFSAIFWLGGILPILMVFANKSTSLALGVATMASLLASIAAGFWPSNRQECIRITRNSAFKTAFALLIWMFLSIAWAHDPKGSLSQFWQFVVPLSFGVVLAITFPRIAPRYRGPLWAGAIFLASTLIALDILTGLHLRKILSTRVVDYQYNRSLVVLIILVWPTLALLLIRGPRLYALAVVPVFIAIFLGASGSAILASLVGIAVFPLAWYFPRVTRQIVLIALFLLIASGPMIGTVSKRTLDQRAHEILAESHSAERQSLWLGYEAAAQEKLGKGYGFGASKGLFADPMTQKLSPELREPLKDTHPHNGFLQIWIELGLTGALLFAVLAVFLMRWIAVSPVTMQPFMLTWVAVISVISTVSHGAWQPWWIAAIAASAVGFITLNKELNERAD
jgi:exopolysaccharide production protein ExoQ